MWWSKRRDKEGARGGQWAVGPDVAWKVCQEIANNVKKGLMITVARVVLIFSLPWFCDNPKPIILHDEQLAVLSCI
jgi:hypothetical protein